MENPTIFILGIILVIAIIIWRLSDVLFFSFRAKKTEGTIVNWMQQSVKGKATFYPLIEFTTQEGEDIQYRADESCEGSPMYPRGTKVTVSYNPKKPKQTKTTYPNNA